MPFLTIWLSYVLNEPGNRGLPWHFFLKPEFWKKLKQLKPGTSNIEISNLTIAYSNSKSKKEMGELDLKKNLALKQFSYK